MYVILVTKGNDVECFSSNTLDGATKKVNELGKLEIYSRWRIAYWDEDNSCFDKDVSEGKF